jgi:predicted nucleotidyltransferase
METLHRVSEYLTNPADEKNFSAHIRHNEIRINNLILFGSSGTGTATPGCDIDIALLPVISFPAS